MSNNENKKTLNDEILKNITNFRPTTSQQDKDEKKTNTLEISEPFEYRYVLA